VPEDQSTMVAIVLSRTGGRTMYRWQKRVEELAAFGMDVVPSLHALLSHEDTTQDERQTAANVLAQLSPELRSDMLAELRTQAQDKYLALPKRAEVARRLVEIEPAALDDVAPYLREVLHDDGQSIFHRAQAAYQLALFDTSNAYAAHTALRRFAVDPELTVEERELSARYLSYLSPAPPEALVSWSLAIARDPAATANVRGNICFLLPTRLQVEMRRSILTDRTASPNRRVHDLTAWEHPVLANEAEAVIRDILAAPESSPIDRVEATTALAALSPRYITGAANLLRELITTGCAAVEASLELANLGQPWRGQVLDTAERVVADETLSRRRRSTAAGTICRLTPHLPEPVVHYLRQQAQAKRTARQHPRANLLPPPPSRRTRPPPTDAR
jgi:hypothetical protein